MFNLDEKLTNDVKQYIDVFYKVYCCEYLIKEFKDYGDCGEELKEVKKILKLLKKEMKKIKDLSINIEAVKTLYNEMVLKYSK